MDDTTRSPKKSSRSGEHRLALDEALKDPANADAEKLGRREAATTSSYPPKVEASDEADIEAMADEVDDASTALVESVDQIVGVLMLVLGKITGITKTQAETAQRTRALIAWTRLTTIVSIFALAAIAVLLYRVEQTADRLRKTQADLHEAVRALRQTDRKVEDVRTQARQSPRVEITRRTEDDAAVVRITPPAPLPNASGTPADPSAAPVEIPIDVDGARVSPKSGSRTSRP